MKFENLKMREEFETIGLLYDDFEEEPHSAVLKYNKNGAVVSYSIDQPFIETVNTQNQQFFITSNGERIVLLNGYLTNKIEHSAGILTLEYFFQYMLVNVTSGNMDCELKKFETFEMNCSYFKDILQKSPFKISSKKDNRFSSNIKAEFKKIIDFSFNYNNNEIHVVDNVKAKQSSFKDNKDISFDSTPFIKVNYEQEISFSELLEEISKVKYLFSFLLDMKIVVNELIVKTNGNKFKMFWSNESEINIGLGNMLKKDKAKELIENHFENIFKNYYLDHRFRDIFETFINNMYKPTYVDDYLVSQLIIIEGLDTRFRDKGRRINIKTRIEKFIEFFDESDLEEVLKYYKINIDFNEEFIKKLSDFRNYHAHLFEIERKAELPVDKYILAKVLRKLIRKYLLVKLLDNEQN